jgi:hypothetical protein
MSVEIKLKPKKGKKNNESDVDICEIDEINNLYSKKCRSNNKEQLNIELENREEMAKNPNENQFLYPILDDPNFNIKISHKKEFIDTKYDGAIYDVEEYAKILKTAEYELLPQQAFVRNFLSLQTPYNSLLLFHGLGSGKTCSSIGVCEEMRDYLNQMGINKHIIIVASPNVQDNFKLQLFDERKLKEVDGIWTMKGCLGNKLLKEINPTGMKGLKREKVIHQVKNLINASYSFKGYLQFSNEIVKQSGKSGDSNETKIRNLENEYTGSLIVIDEVHNIRISDDNENKNVAKNLMYLVSVVSNLRLLLLSATPMFNSYKEIVWLLNLMNMNDRRGIVSVSDIFDSNGDWKKDKDGNDIGKELLMRKATGYVSYVRGENPYTFPFRVYPDRFSKKHTFNEINEYPKYQINGRKIPDDRKIDKLSLYLTNIGKYQKMGYDYIVDRLRNRGQRTILTKKGKERNLSAFLSLKSVAYTDLLLPIEALNIIYPYDGLEELTKNIPKFEYIDEEEDVNHDIAPKIKSGEQNIINVIDDIFVNGPQFVDTHKSNDNNNKSELESEPVVNEGVEGDETMNDKVVELDKRQLKSVSPRDKIQSQNYADSIYDQVDNEVIDNEEDEGPLINTKGGTVSSDDERLYIDPKELTGSQGLKRVMQFEDTKTPSIKGNFEYKRGIPRIFSNNEIGKYSSKIKTICDYIYDEKTKKVSDGIILIYSSYIDGGIIPMALALEEMGFTRYGDKATPLFKSPPVPVVDVRTMKPPTSKKDFKPARYIMITGDSRISPNNDADVKAITNNNNIYKEEDGTIKDISGEVIKVVLISQAGSEGLDFKAIRQVHILEPWYNVNRIEQIIGRAVRNFSHKDLPFTKNNVQIFLYGTILENVDEEAADLYVYRMAELGAVKMGRVSRVLKQTAVDCRINHEQTELTAENFKKIEENRNILQILSDHQKIDHFQIGDIDNTATCDFMECEFKCLPDISIEDSIKNTDTYNETFMLINSDKIIQKVKSLMKMRYFYKKHEFFQLINTPKKYPTSQIYSALTQIINDNSEYIVDKYERTGYLINIGDYYLFQPSELNYKNISVYDRSVPIDYKHNMINFEIKNNIAKPVIDKRNINNQLSENNLPIVNNDVILNNVINGKNILDTMFENYNLALETSKVTRGNDNWYEHCGVVLQKMSKEDRIIPANSTEERFEILKQYLIEHIVDSLMMNEKIDLLNYIYSDSVELTNEKLETMYEKIKKYLLSKLVVSKGIKGIVIFDGPSRIENLHIFVLDNKQWIEATPEDKRDLESAILKKYQLKKNMFHYVGFIGFENNKKYMVYKVKDTENKRSTGFRCDQSGKSKIINLLNDIESDEKYASKKTKEGVFELCVRQEFTLRSYQQLNLDNKTWFLDTETAIINEFEKKEKDKK